MAAQDAELKLKVSLDLAFFRQQLAGLGQAAAGYNMPINVKLDRSAITKELRNLERAIGKKKINVELNLLGGLTKDQLEKIQGRLEALSKTKKVEIPVSVKNGATGRDIQDAITGIRQRIEANQQIRQGGGKLRVATSIKPSITNADVSEFKKVVQQKLSGISVKVKAEVERGFAAGPTGAAGLFEYMRSQGLSGGNVPQATEVGRSERLKKALNDLTVKQLQALAKEQGIGGVSKMRKDPLIEKLVAELNQDIAENILGNIKNQLRDVGKGPLKSVLDTFARGLFNMLGMDMASMRQQMAARRALPPVSFPATVPPRSVPIGPSSTGRALPPGAIPSALPGTAFGGQKYLPTDLGAELKQILRGAAYAFVDAVSREVRTARIGVGASMQAALPSARIAGLLPAGVGREPSRYATGAIGGETREQMMARRTAEAYARSALRGMDVMGGGAGRPPSPYNYAYRSARPMSAIVPYAAGGAMVATGVGAGGGGAVPPSGGGGGGRGGFGGMGGFGGFGRALGGLNLPGTGTIRELGSEFAFATKQVLLFGQAYKMLGFIQDFPAQVSQAVSELQSFRNTLNSVTGSAEAASDANEFILAAVERYSIPLQSARDGFVKLFASMEPAGFAAGEIQNLFLGITKAAATYGMSADKVDRVNYAFAQMASKGQVMSEELKGQLGDVLPGAMGIFAEAAGFKGPDAIQKFGKALEDGVYKGGEMRKLLKNVADGMNKEFGPGAEGAAKTFQGSINRMQTALKQLYESFEPAAIGVLNQVAVPLVSTLKNLTAGINAYFQGQAAATPEAQKFADAMKTIVPTISGIAQNLGFVATQVGAMAEVFGFAALQIGRLLALPIVGNLVSTYAQVLILTTAFNVLAKSAIGAAIIAIGKFIGQGIVYAQVSLGMRVATQQTTVAMYQFGTAVQTVMIKSVIGIALVAIGAFISKIVELRGQLAAISGSAKSMEDLAKSSAKLGDVEGTKEAVGNIQDRLATYKQLRAELAAVQKAGQRQSEGAAAGTSQELKLTTALGNKLVELGLINKRVLQQSSNGYKMNEIALDGVSVKIEENIEQFEAARQRSAKYTQQAIDAKRKLEQQGKISITEEGDPKALAKAAEEARKLADDKRKYEADLMKIGSQQAISLNEMEFDHWKSLQQAKYDFLEAGQNEWMSREIKFQRDLQAIEIRRIEAIRKARIDTVKAETEAQASAYVAGGTSGATGLMQGSTGISSGPHFDVRRADGSRITEAEARALFDPSVSRRLQMTSGYGPRNTGIPGASRFHKGIDLAGPANTPLNLAPGYSMQSAGMEDGLGYTANIRGPQGQMYKVGHLQQPKTGMPASRVRAEAKKDYASALASQEAINAKERENAQIKYANIQAQQELNILVREYTASIVPVEQQRLENTLLENRISLISSGAFGAALDTEQKISEARERATLGVQMANKAIEENNKLAADGIYTQEEAARLNALQAEKIKQLTEGLQNYVPLLRERLQLEQANAEALLKGEIQRATPLGGMGLAAGYIGPAGDRYMEAIGRGATPEAASQFAELQNQLTLLETRNESIKQSIYGIGNAFGEAMTTGVAGLVAGTSTAKEVFANFLQSVGQALSQAASQMIATYIAIGIAKMFAGLSGGGLFGGGASIQGGGFGSFTGGDFGVGGVADLPGLSGAGALAGGGGIPSYAGLKFANGGIARDGFRAFANGGVVSGPTLGLVGEGKYNEAIVPLPDGKSIPVQMRGGQSSRDLLSNGAQSQSSPSVLSMSFQSTTINGVEYVSRDQLEAAMMETRKLAARDGANRGASLALDRLQNSPNARRRVGI